MTSIKMKNFVNRDLSRPVILALNITAMKYARASVFHTAFPDEETLESFTFVSNMVLGQKGDTYTESYWLKAFEQRVNVLKSVNVDIDAIVESIAGYPINDLEELDFNEKVIYDCVRDSIADEASVLLHQMEILLEEARSIVDKKVASELEENGSLL